MKKIINFNELEFHDSKLYGLGFDEKKFELLLDIDFTKQWSINADKYHIELIPSTIVFYNVWNIMFDLSSNLTFIINQIQRNNPTTPKNIKYLPANSTEYDWHIEFLEGDITFKSIGMTIFSRTTNSVNNYSIEERKGICLGKIGEQILIT